MNTLRKTLFLGQLSKRVVSTETRSTVSSAFKAKQELMQVNDGRPVHLKGGTMDGILMQLTFVLCAVGLGGCMKLYYDLSVPKK